MKYISVLSLSFSLLFAASCGSSNGGGGTDTGARNTLGLGPAAVSLSTNGGILTPGDMGSAGSYAILAKTGISNSGPTVVTGNIGVSPAAESYVTGFTITDAVPRTHATAPEVFAGFFIFAADMVSPTPSNLTTSIGSMETAYTNAAGRTSPDFVELAAGDLSGLTLVPGLYKWGTGVIIPTNITIAGTATDVWIFQIAQDLNMSANMTITLTGGAKAENIFWVVAGQADILAGAHFEGIILCKTAVNFVTGATMNGRVYAQAEVTLLSNTITQP